MVTTTVERLSPTRVKLNITVTPEELKPSITHAYQHIAESVNIPGFRKGKVPPPIIDQRVGRAEVISHAVNEGIDKFYRDAAREEGLKPLGRPQADVTQLPNEKDFSGDLQLLRRGGCSPRLHDPELRLAQARGRADRRHPRRGRERTREPAHSLRHPRHRRPSGEVRRLRDARPGRHDRRRRSRHREQHLLRARLRRTDRGHRRSARHAHCRRGDHV